MKDEKEEKRAKVRKARDAFLKMLAECAEIDSKSRWRGASVSLFLSCLFLLPLSKSRVRMTRLMCVLVHVYMVGLIG